MTVWEGSRTTAATAPAAATPPVTAASTPAPAQNPATDCPDEEKTAGGRGRLGVSESRPRRPTPSAHRRVTARPPDAASVCAPAHQDRQKWLNVTSGSTSHAATAGRVTHRFTAPAAPSSRHGGTGRHRTRTWRPTGVSGTSRWRKANGLPRGTSYVKGSAGPTGPVTGPVKQRRRRQTRSRAATTRR
jgi:hypothetical protein